jgi:hypothetical protein
VKANKEQYGALAKRVVDILDLVAKAIPDAIEMPAELLPYIACFTRRGPATFVCRYYS